MTDLDYNYSVQSRRRIRFATQRYCYEGSGMYPHVETTIGASRFDSKGASSLHYLLRSTIINFFEKMQRHHWSRKIGHFGKHRWMTTETFSMYLQMTGGVVGSISDGRSHRRRAWLHSLKTWKWSVMFAAPKAIDVGVDDEHDCIAWRREGGRWCLLDWHRWPSRQRRTRLHSLTIWRLSVTCNLQRGYISKGFQRPAWKLKRLYFVRPTMQFCDLRKIAYWLWFW